MPFGKTSFEFAAVASRPQTCYAPRLHTRGRTPGRQPGKRSHHELQPGALLRSHKLRRPRPRLEQPHGKENCRLYQTASAGRGGQSVAADRSRARPARPQHHGILQGVQCAHRAIGEGHADSGRHHRLSGPLVHLRDAPAAGDLLPEEGGGTEDRQEARFRREDARPRLCRQGDERAGARDRGEEDRRSQLRYDRGGDEDDRRLRPLDGPAGGRAKPWRITAREL